MHDEKCKSKNQQWPVWQTKMAKIYSCFYKQPQTILQNELRKR